MASRSLLYFRFRKVLNIIEKNVCHMNFISFVCKMILFIFSSAFTEKFYLCFDKLLLISIYDKMSQIIYAAL